MATKKKSTIDDWFEQNTVPYARGRVVKGKGVERTCPVPGCGQKFLERTDRYGEQTTDNYAKHYDKEHR